MGSCLFDVFISTHYFSFCYQNVITLVLSIKAVTVLNSSLLYYTKNYLPLYIRFIFVNNKRLSTTKSLQSLCQSLSSFIPSIILAISWIVSSNSGAISLPSPTLLSSSSTLANSPLSAL